MTLRYFASLARDPKLGNPVEMPIRDFAETICRHPQQRKPDITKARQFLGWEPKVPLEEGLAKTCDYFRAL